MKIVFFGINSVYSILPLLALREKYEIAAVFTSGSLPNETFLARLKNIVKKGDAGPAYSLEKTSAVYGIPYFHFTSINSGEAINQLKNSNPEVICMSGFNEKLSPEIINIPAYGIINAHSSMLPSYRGSNPFFHLISGDRTKAGVTLHKVNEKLDDGEILASAPVAVYSGMNLSAYNTLVAGKAAELFPEVIGRITSGTVIHSENKKDQTRFARNPVASDFCIKNTDKVEDVLWKFNAYSDKFVFQVETGDGIKQCSAVSLKPFTGSTEYKMTDGVIYILQA